GDRTGNGRRSGAADVGRLVEVAIGKLGGTADVQADRKAPLAGDADLDTMEGVGGIEAIGDGEPRSGRDTERDGSGRTGVERIVDAELVSQAQVTIAEQGIEAPLRGTADVAAQE